MYYKTPLFIFSNTNNSFNKHSCISMCCSHIKAQALLFTGPRGVGKTTCARIPGKQGGIAGGNTWDVGAITSRRRDK